MQIQTIRRYDLTCVGVKIAQILVTYRKQFGTSRNEDYLFEISYAFGCGRLFQECQIKEYQEKHGFTIKFIGRF